MVADSPKQKQKEAEGPCPFCKNGVDPDYKDYKSLKEYLSERARILGKEKTGVCAKHQRMLSREIKRARYLGLLPYIPKI